MLTLVEAAKLHSGDVLKSGVIELYARNSPVLENLPFQSIEGNAFRYNREDKLPGVGFRGVNEGYTESSGVLNPQVETLSIAGGDLDVDKFIVDTMGEDQRTSHESMKVRALALRWSKAFIKGDSDSNPREFDGLQVRITGSQLIENSASGAAMSLAKLDELIDQVNNPTHLIMNKTMRRLITVAARTYTIGGFITYGVDAFGRQVAKYNDLPILILDEDEAGNQILQFNEAGSSSGSTSTSIYCSSMSEGYLHGLENGSIDVRDLGEIEAKPVLRTRVEWYSGMALMHGKSAARLRGITNAAVVV